MRYQSIEFQSLISMYQLAGGSILQYLHIYNTYMEYRDSGRLRNIAYYLH